jgi:SagB-type dehydrogenase family enzyme
MVGNNGNSILKIDNDLFKLSFKHKITDDDEVALQSFFDAIGFHYQLKDLTFVLKKGLLAINTNSFSKNELGSIVLKNGNYGDLSLFLYYVSHLEVLGAFAYKLYTSDQLFCRYENMTGPTDFSHTKNYFSSFKLSKFSFVRLINEEYILESSIGTSKIALTDPHSIQLVFLLSKFKTIQEISTFLSLDETLVHSFYTLLSTGDFLEFESATNENAALELWNFHDLLFHNRSRYGRHNYTSGATYRFLDTKPPKAIKKQIRNALKIISLEKPLTADFDQSKTLQECLDTRNSSREFEGFDLQSLGHFLYRTLKLNKRSEYTLEDQNDKKVTFETYKAPYPSGGAIYELNFYITILDCQGLEPGFYYYNPIEHELSLLQHQNKQTELMLWYANACTGMSKAPPVLITFSADFERMFWKYESMAYAAILKHVGVVYQTMYLVATDMNIGACALGNGNTEIFKSLTNNSLLKESSVGEFILGRKLKNKIT